MLLPLKEFICDKCQGIIESPQYGYLQWDEFDDENNYRRARNFQIVHNYPHSEEDCLDYNKPSKQLIDFLNPDSGIGALLSFIDYGPLIQNNFLFSRAYYTREIIELIRRLSIPYFEEARDYLTLALNDDYISTNQYGIYNPNTLKSIIEIYGTNFK